ncbi:MAG: DNA-directed RNA polymerase subunit beta', partial [Clostridia bacterium]|nr:DNA-directed RNA polymerase subunit beta' [Clostridia bacterium]
VIARNNRLKKLQEIHTPDIVIRNEKRMLQEAVDALIDNGRRGKPVTGPSNRALKSLSEMLRGKQGRFRQNLLGKRVDYSGRSVIVVGPSLKIYQCGLPKEMALELFKPFVVKRLVEMGKAANVKEAQKKIERVYGFPDVWDALENVIKEHPVLLNRAPTLHRLSIQAFEPVLVEGRAIKLHPLVCTAFNADFDGDQMPVHVPLSVEAQAEARFLMLSCNNLLKPMDGKAVTVPTQDMILGSYYLTMEKAGEPGDCTPVLDENGAPMLGADGEPMFHYNMYRNFDEANMAYANHKIGLHSRIKVRVSKDFTEVDETGAPVTVTRSAVIITTLGRLIFNQNLPQNLGFVDRTKPENAFRLEVEFVVKKKQLGQIIDRCIRANGTAVCAAMLDEIKAMGYKYSTQASFSISVYDMTIPPEKADYLAAAQKDVDKITKHFMRGELSEEERYKSVVKIWESTTDNVTAALDKGFSKFNPIKIMADSGARGSMTQMRQLAGMRGLMFSATGKTMELPIKSNFREGLNITEYFMGARSSRKSLSDTALRTADSGYLTRRLVDVSQEVIVREVNCHSDHGTIVTDVIDERDKNVLEALSDRIIGRFVVRDVVNPETGEVIVPEDTMITEEQAAAITAAGIKEVEIRTPIQCRSKLGICAHCYGADMSSGKLVSVGEAVGIIAAQAIGEPGTQLTMRTFHSGGVAGSDITQGLPRVEELFEARAPKKAAIMTEKAGVAYIQANPDMPGVNDILVHDADSNVEVAKYTIPYGMRLAITDGQSVVVGQALTEGSKAPADIMRIQGLDEVYAYLIKEVQKVYRSQSCNVNDKHIEIIARQMTRKVRVDDGGDTDLLPGSVVDCIELEEANEAVQARIDAGETDLKLAEAETILLGITKAALQSESFLSAASFQETTKVLADAAIRGKVDHLRGLKENVIIGRLIPAGTGMECYKEVAVQKVEAPVEGAV